MNGLLTLDNDWWYFFSVRG